MVGLKNSSSVNVSLKYDGVSFFFTPGEIKVVAPEVATHLLSTSASCAIGGSPLKVLLESDIPKELLAAPPSASPELILLRNKSEKDFTILDSGKPYVFPAGESRALPKTLGNELFTRRVASGYNDIEILTPAPVPTDEPAPSVTPEPSEAAGVEVKKKKSKWRI